jgi:SAM-dependent methyltransferase
VASILWGPELASVHDDVYTHLFDAATLGPMVDRLVELADGGAALELAVGTGRVALPLAARGVEVHGIDLSPHMIDRLRDKPGADTVAVTVGDMTTTRVPGRFTLVYLVANTIMNVTTQDEQVAVFANAAAHLEPGGCFALQVVVPWLGSMPIDEPRVFTFEPDHVGIDTIDDLVGQITSSHHWMSVGGRVVRHSAPYRYVWPSELDLMARLTGFRLRDRWADWTGAPFTGASTSQVVVYERVATA